MKKNKIFIVLLLVILFSLSFRVPIAQKYPTGTDTYTMYKLSTDIQQKKYIEWILSPISLTGYFPLSYQTGGILLLSEISLILGTNFFNTLIYWDIFMIIVIGVLIYLIAKTIFKNNFLSIISVLVYLNVRFLIYYTTWYYSVRNLFLILFVTFIWLLLSKKFRFKYTLIFIICTLMIITHKLFIVLPILLLSYLIAYFVWKKEIHKSKFFAHIILLLTTTLFIGSVFINGIIKLAPTIGPSFKIHNVFLNQLVYLIFTYATQIGLTAFFFVIGYLALIYKKNKDRNDIFIIVTFILFAPILTEPTYIGYIILPFFAITIVYGIKFLIERRVFNTLFYKKMIIVILLIFLIAPMFIKTYTVYDDSIQPRDQTIQLTNYFMKINDTKTVICNYHEIYCNHITALSENSIPSLSTSSDLLNVKKFNISNISIIYSLKKIAIFKEPIFDRDYFDEMYEGYLIRYHPDKITATRIVDFFKIEYIVDTNFIESVSNENSIRNAFGGFNNQIYNNGLQKVQYLGAQNKDE